MIGSPPAVVHRGLIFALAAQQSIIPDCGNIDSSSLTSASLRPRGRRTAERRDEQHLQDGAENAMSKRIGYLLPTRERIMARQLQAAPLLELAERAERVSVPLRCPSWRASPSARRRATATESPPAPAASCRHRSPDDRGRDHVRF